MAFERQPNPRTLYEKLWDAHVVATAANGQILLYIDRHPLHEVSTPRGGHTVPGVHALVVPGSQCGWRRRRKAGRAVPDDGLRVAPRFNGQP